MKALIKNFCITKMLIFVSCLVATAISSAMEQSAQLANVSAHNTVLQRLISVANWLAWSAKPEDKKSKKLYTAAIDAQTILKTKFNAVHQQIDTNPLLHLSNDYQELLNAFTNFSDAVTAFNDDKLEYNEWWKQHCLPYRSDLSDSDNE